ncbi:uncharacterized protein LOC125242314 isoform X1 [Leguminivora glycinivorella]|uniref:uncharacterized protein LOC125242314 isoform X1 n=2 Tax=Leguminivora glycinivorella TaxID=1035111 RepID=UPI002010134B|nr:uncharacterized protein LOC125242314 isoform X1 [Leguminivora glycinivorella]
MSLEDFSTLSGVYPVLTDERLSKALSDWFKENVTFTRWEYVGETGKGDSYLSELMRINIFGKTDSGDPKNVKIILKSIPRSLSRRLTFRSDEFFKNEIKFYTEVLPAMLKFQSTKNLSEPFDNCPKAFLTYIDGENDIICLEDVSIYNFGPYAVRQEGIDYKHCKQTYKTMAKFHALSFAMRDQQPEEFNRISNLIFETYYDDRLWDWYETFWKRLCGIAIDAVEKEYPNSKYVEKVKEFAVPERYKEMVKAVRDRTNGVIGHGDSWTNNFLYKYMNGRPVDAMMIDFQLTRCASPVLDTSFVIYGCTTEDMREKHYDELLKYYYEVLSNQIRAYGSDPDKVYSWDIYMEEVKKYSFFGLAFSFESTPHIVLPPEEACDMNMEGDKKRNIDEIWPMTPFKTKEGRQREANNVKHCVDHGYI